MIARNNLIRYYEFVTNNYKISTGGIFDNNNNPIISQENAMINYNGIPLGKKKLFYGAFLKRSKQPTRRRSRE